MENWMEPANSIAERLKALEGLAKSYAPVIRTAIIALTILGILLFTNAFMQQRKQIKEYTDDIAQFEVDLNTANVFVDSLKNEIKLQDKLIYQSTRHIDSLDTTVEELEEVNIDLQDRLESLRVPITVIPNDTINQIIQLQDSIIVHKDQIIAVKDETIDELDTIIRRKDINIMFLTSSVDSLQTVIRTMPEFPIESNKYFGFIPKPSRTTTAAVSFLGGVIVTLLVTGK